jgi:RNA polymerase sigma factor (sigma-70 family)
MHSRDYGYGMRDSDVVAAVVAGDPDGLARAYDKYAAPLYTYCKSLLREPADAADAVQDTFLIAATRLAGLRDRDRLRPWLYAVARNECLRRIRSRAATTALEEAQDVTDENADVGSDAERAELRALMRAAVRGLNPADQEVVELQLRQGLDAAEIADVLGVSRNHAHALISRARDQLEICLGVLLVARTGRQDCPELNAMLDDWDGQLTVLLRKRLNRHIEHCEICTGRRRSALRPATLLGLAPLVALPAVVAPSGLRDQILRLVSSSRPDAVAHRAAVARRIGSFSEHGFPRPLRLPKAHWWLERPVHIAAGVAAAAAITVAAVTIPGPPQHHTAASAGLTPSAGSSSAGAQASAGASSSGRPQGRATQPGKAGLPGPGQTAAPGQTGAAGPTVPPSQGTQASQSAEATASSPAASATSTARATSPSSSATTPAATAAATTPAAPSPSKSPAPTVSTPVTVAPGTLTVAPASVVLSTLGGTAITITAVGGPVSWSISEPVSLVGELNFSAISGTLQAGAHTEVTATVDGLLSLDSVITISPGGHTVSVILGLL